MKAKNPTPPHLIQIHIGAEADREIEFLLPEWDRRAGHVDATEGET